MGKFEHHVHVREKVNVTCAADIAAAVDRLVQREPSKDAQRKKGAERHADGETLH